MPEQQKSGILSDDNTRKAIYLALDYLLRKSSVMLLPLFERSIEVLDIDFTVSDAIQRPGKRETSLRGSVFPFFPLYHTVNHNSYDSSRDGNHPLSHADNICCHPNTSSTVKKESIKEVCDKSFILPGCLKRQNREERYVSHYFSDNQNSTLSGGRVNDEKMATAFLK